MLTGRTGRRVSPAPGKRKQAAGYRTNRKDAGGAKGQAGLLRLVVCGSLFVLLVAVKLLLPGRMTELDRTLSAALNRNMDVKAVFAAVGELFTREGGAASAAEEVYRAVFQPEVGEADKTSADSTDTPLALTELKAHRLADMLPAGESGAGEVDTENLVLYSDEELPENVSMRQAILGFDHQTPVKGALSSCFGYRQHPTEGEERFHYGVDLAADSGTAIGCLADGTVTAVGESSSYGKYCTVTHDNGCTTLYAHCSRISVSSGAAVKAGEKLGEVGQTGMATGPHLHFELQKDGVYLNPVYYVETA